MRLTRRGSVRAAVFLLASAVAVLATFSTASADPAKTGYPNSMASTGDSITRAFDTCPMALTDCPANSWSTGTSAEVNSQYSRILASNSLINGNNFNDAVSGARMSNLNGQVTNVNGQHVEYVTILMGANDICTSSEATMTTASTFLTQFQTAMSSFSAASPDARIYVASIPDIFQLWSILHTDSTAAQTWTSFGICQSMLLNPTSMAQTDVDRRARVRQRNIDLNTQLQQVCAQYIHCRSDNNAGFNLAFTPDDVSNIDYFHPSVAGQAIAASGSYSTTFDFTDNTAPVSSPSTITGDGGVNVALNASDNVGVSGSEYKIDVGASWVRYTSPVFVAYGSTITYRAVDVDGNIEATHTFVASPTVGGIAEAPAIRALPSNADAGWAGARRLTAVVALAALGAVVLAGFGVRLVRRRPR